VWLQTSAAFGDPLGQSRLGDAYQYGIGVPQNRKRAIHWHYEATLRGNGHSASEFARLSKSGTFIGFYNADERALFPGMPTLLIYAEPADTLFHNSAERRAYMAGAAQQHAAAEAQSARDVGRADYQRRKNEYDQCTGAGGSNCRNPGPPPH
jgi:TPR repeat protein